MGYHPRIESSEIATLATVRSRNSELWFINNPSLEEAVLGYLAKFSERYSVDLYGFALEGNHMHSLADYLEQNRSDFQRDLNSCVARAVPRYVPSFPGGGLWARRYSGEFVPEAEDIEEYFFYLVLQPVRDGLVDRISDYPGYNCFSDAVNGVVRKFKVIDWASYNEKKRWSKKVNLKDFTQIVELKYKRLPGYEHLSQQEYRKIMLEKLESRRVEAIRERGKPAVGAAVLRQKRPGTTPINSKRSKRWSHRPRILCINPARRRKHYEWYFSIYWSYRESSKKYRSGDLTVEFPPGTYRPHLFTCKSKPPGFPELA